jgi:hypothetical protein
MANLDPCTAQSDEGQIEASMLTRFSLRLTTLSPASRKQNRKNAISFHQHSHNTRLIHFNKSRQALRRQRELQRSHKAIYTISLAFESLQNCPSKKAIFLDKIFVQIPNISQRIRHWKAPQPCPDFPLSTELRISSTLWKIGLSLFVSDEVCTIFESTYVL